MGATFAHKFGHDAKAIAEARRLKNRERKARHLARLAERGQPLPVGTVRPELWQGEVPKDWKGAGDGDEPLHIPALPPKPVVEEKREEPKRMDDPLRHLRQGNRVPVEVLVWIGDEPIRLAFSTNMRGTLNAAQMTEQALSERLGKALKEAFG